MSRTSCELYGKSIPAATAILKPLGERGVPCYNRRMHRTSDYVLAAAIGSVISVMVVLNTRFGQVSTMAVSFLFNHMIGIIAITIIMIGIRLHRNEPTERRKAPWYLYFGGLFGFLIINANYITITNIGASLSMATAVFGQSLGSLLFDLTGFMGMRTYRISRKKVLTLSVSFIGIAIMASQGGSFSIPYVIIGTATGILTMVQMVYNSRLASYKGVLFSARNNVISGFVFASLVYALTSAERTLDAITHVTEVPIHLILGGGLLAVIVVTGTNHVIPRIPAIYSALLLSSAQIITSIILDAIMFGLFSMHLLIGALVILCGMLGNVWVDRQEQASHSDRMP